MRATRVVGALAPVVIEWPLALAVVLLAPPMLAVALVPAVALVLALVPAVVLPPVPAMGLVPMVLPPPLVLVPPQAVVLALLASTMLAVTPPVRWLAATAARCADRATSSSPSLAVGGRADRAGSVGTDLPTMNDRAML